jgi:hypothetical protein
MTTFDDRERAFEAKFASEEELKFKVMARRDLLLGAWVGAKLGLTGEALETYARSTLKANLQEPGDEDVVRKVLADAGAQSVVITAEEVRAKLSEFEAEAGVAVHAGV